MQKNDRYALGARLVGQPKAGHGQLDARIGAVAGLDPVHVLAQVTSAFSAEQGHGK
ncbi:hypothetical protein D3C76_1765700 [compost metagenome]